MLGTDDWVDICNMLFSYCIGSTHLILFDVKPRYVCQMQYFVFSIFDFLLLGPSPSKDALEAAISDTYLNFALPSLQNVLFNF